MIEFFQYVARQWERRYGGIFAAIFLLSLCYLLWRIVPVDLKDYIEPVVLISMVLIAELILVSFWAYSTKRLVVPSRKKISIALAISTEDEHSTKAIKVVVRRAIKELQEKQDQLDIRILVLPINMLTSQKQASRYLQRNLSLLDAVLFMELDSGKQKSVSKMVISKIHFVVKRANVEEKIKIYYEQLHLDKDIRLTGSSKDWTYIEDNSYDDRGKLTENLVGTILHFAGLYAIIIDDPELAIRILWTVFKPELREFKVKASETVRISLKPNHIVAARLAALLIDLYSRHGFQEYDRHNVEEALESLRECEDKLSRHKYSFNNYIGIARMSFELGDLPAAKEYTAKAKSISPSNPSIKLNEAWFYAIDSDADSVARIYRSFLHKGFGKNFNATDLLEFWDRHKQNYPDARLIIDFLEGFVTRLYVDKNEGNNILKKFIEEINEDKRFNTLVKLATETIDYGSSTTKSVHVQQKSNRVHQKGNKRKRKRRKKGR